MSTPPPAAVQPDAQISSENAKAVAPASAITPPASDKGASDKGAEEEDCGCGDETKVAPTTNAPPTAAELQKMDDLVVCDADGNKRSFRSLYTSPEADRHLILFVRHFFCGNCQEFIRHLATHIPPSSLPPRTAITLISNGTPSLIPSYVSATSSPYPVYTDPDRALYIALKLGRSKSMGPKKPEYIKQSLLGGILGSIYQGLSSGRDALKGGDFWQVGGEFLFVKKGEEWVVDWAHRMRTTRDHAEVAELKQVLGMGDAEKGGAAAERTRGWKSGITELGKWRNGRSSSRSARSSPSGSETGKRSSVKGEEKVADPPIPTSTEKGKGEAKE